MNAVKTGEAVVVRPGPVFWASLTPAQQHELLRVEYGRPGETFTRPRPTAHFRPGDTITQQDALATSLVIVHEGWLKSVLPTARSTSMMLRLYGPGDLLGTEALVPGACYSESTVAQTSCQVRKFTVDEFAAQLGKAEFASALHQIEMQRRSCTERRLQAMASSSGEERVAQTLVGLAETFGETHQEGGPLTFPVPFVQEEISALAGTHRNTTVRALEKFRRKQVITTHRRQIEILNLAALRDCMG